MVGKLMLLMDEEVDTQVETGAAVISASKLFFLTERHSWQTVELLLHFLEEPYLHKVNLYMGNSFFFRMWKLTRN